MSRCSTAAGDQVEQHPLGLVAPASPVEGEAELLLHHHGRREGGDIFGTRAIISSQALTAR